MRAPVFCLRRLFIACYRVSCYLFFFVSAGQHSKSPTCLGMGNKEIRGMYYLLCVVVCFIIFLLSLYFLLTFPLCSRIVWGYLCRGGLRRAGWPGLICLVNNISIVSSACGRLNAFLIYVLIIQKTATNPLINCNPINCEPKWRLSVGASRSRL